MSVVRALTTARRPALGFVVLGGLFGALAAHLPELKSGLGASDARFGLLLLGAPLGLLVAVRIAPWIDARAGAWAPAGAAAGMGAVTPLLAWAPDQATFFAAMVALGVVSGLVDVLINARTGDLEAAGTGPLMNAVHGSFSLAYGLAALGCAPLRAAGVPAEVTLTVLGVAALAGAGALRIAPGAIAEDAPERLRRLPRAVWIGGGLVLLSFLVEAAVESWSALHVERTLGGAPGQGALGPAMLGLTMAVGRFGGQALTARVSEGSVIAAGAVLATSGAVLAAAAPGPLWGYVGFGAVGLGVSVIGPLALGRVGRGVGARDRTRAISAAAALGFVAFVVAPVLMGLLAEGFGLRAAFAVLALAALACWPLARAAPRPGVRV
ncbi:MAG: MFS transporter [Paracoccaceae bacterium]